MNKIVQSLFDFYYQIYCALIEMDKNSTNNYTGNIFVKGAIIAIIITVPSLLTFFVSWYFLDDLISAAIIGTAVHFIGLMSSFRFAKRIFVSNLIQRLNLNYIIKI